MTARYTIRVHLQDATDETYLALDTLMVEAGLKLTFKDSNGHEFLMPPGEYNLVSEMNAMAVRNHVAKVAARMRRKYTILVTEAAKRFGLNLPPVNAGAGEAAGEADSEGQTALSA